MLVSQLAKLNFVSPKINDFVFDFDRFRSLLQNALTILFLGKFSDNLMEIDDFKKVDVQLLQLKETHRQVCCGELKN